MKQFAKWLTGGVLALLLLLAAVAMALQYWVDSDDFRIRVSRQMAAAVGLPVHLGRISVDLWPLPAVALEQVRLASRPPLTLERVEARPEWAGLLRGRLDIATLVVRDAVVPEDALAAMAAPAVRSKRDQASEGGSPARGVIDFLPRRVVLDRVTWVQAKGGSITVTGQARFDADGMPATAQLEVLKGRFERAQGTLRRESDHWALRATLGGGSITGKFQAKGAARGALLLQGQLDIVGVEVAALTAPSRTLTGQLDAHTGLRAEARELGALADALQTQTRFTVRNAVVHGIDLASAVKSVGLSRGGETRLDTLAGNISTQGRALHLTNLVASSGALSATGNVAMAPNRSLSGRITVDLASAAAGGAIGVPLAVGGTLDAPSVTLTRGALVGAAVGTILAPGVGTGAGVKLGDRLEEGLKGLFGR